MPRVGAAEEMQTLEECHYSFPRETISDLRKVRSLFSDLRLYVDFYSFPNKERKKLLYLAGTLPVSYEGSDYNIPVCIWLHETHPATRPRCYVWPSVTMVINQSCPCVDAVGNITVDGLGSWSRGVSDLSKLVSEMRRAFQQNTPLYARGVAEAPPSPAAAQSLQHAKPGLRRPPPPSPSSSIMSWSPQRQPLPWSGHNVEQRSPSPSVPDSQWEQSREVTVRRSYTEELLGIDFGAPPPPSNNPFLSSAPSGLLPSDGAEQLIRTSEVGASPTPPLPSQAAHHGDGFSSAPPGSGSRGREVRGLVARLPPQRRANFLALMALEGRSFSPDDIMEAVQLNPDLPSALKFLTHRCPICQEEVSFSKMVTMTHCSCFLCQSCFSSFFCSAIKEKSVDQLVCPQCGRPEVRGHMEEAMEYFNLLDTQIRHFLPPQIHELFQRKLRDRALQDMPDFRWCAHCSFGLLHEAERLRMDCPSCKKSTCSRCRSPWSPQHQNLHCPPLENQLDVYSGLLSTGSIECPRCRLIFSLSHGGCLHFTCSQCGHQFCGGCSQTFSPGRACGFSADCANKGLHAHHPRDCIYHLRDWSLARLQLLLQYYRVSPSWLRSPKASSAGVCGVLELRDDVGKGEEPCSRPALPEHQGYCRSHYAERLVELINRCRLDPAALFSPAEMAAELRRWNVAVPAKKPEEAEPLYAQRLRQTLSSRLPLRMRRHKAARPSAAAAAAASSSSSQAAP